MRFRLAIVLSALSGFVALSYEILWIRAYTYLSWGQADAFGLLLGAYLAGIAFGSFFARRFCEEGHGREVRALALFLLAANLLGYVAVPAAAELALHAGHAVTLLLFGLAAAMLGGGFPLVAHYGIEPGDHVGARLSYLYLFNILGSAAGSLLTGFVLLDVLSLRAVSVALVVVGIGMSLLVAVLARLSRRVQIGFGLAAVLAAVASGPLFTGVYEKLVLKDEYTPGDHFALVIENRSGVVAVDRRGVVYGNGIYDGQFNVDPVHDTNGVIRAYAVAALRPDARDILVVGLGSGSWTQVLAHMPGVEHVTVIEINPAYIELLEYSPVVASLKTNPKVEFIVDDGRRWLARHDHRFDAIVQNTTYHYRAHATNLLSREYFELCRKRLKPGGLLFYNTTHSLDAQRTGLAVYRHARLLHHGMYVSDTPLPRDPARFARTLAAWTIDGRPVATPEEAAEIVAHAGWLDREAVEELTKNAEVITDDNMACEWN